MKPSNDNSEITSVETRVGWRRRLGGVLAACVAVLLVAAGCNSDPGDPSGPLSATSPEEVETTPAEPTPADEAKEALEEYLEARDATFLLSDQDAPGRANSLIVGREWEYFHQTVELYVANEYTVTGEWGHSLGEPERLSAEEYRIIDCEDGSNVEILNKDGNIVGRNGPDSQPLADRYEWAYTVVKQDGRWLVEYSNFVFLDFEAGEYKTC